MEKIITDYDLHEFSTALEGALMICCILINFSSTRLFIN